MGCMNSSTRISPTVAGLRFVINTFRLGFRKGSCSNKELKRDDERARIAARATVVGSITGVRPAREELEAKLAALVPTCDRYPEQARLSASKLLAVHNPEHSSLAKLPRRAAFRTEGGRRRPRAPTTSRVALKLP
jgi:hypothetical protein